MNKEKLDMATAARRIADWERLLPADSPAWGPLAHARKEYAHALNGGDEAFHLSIVERDLFHVAGLVTQ